MRVIVGRFVAVLQFLLLALHPAVAAADGSIASGENLVGTISTAGEIDTWTFTADLDERIVLRVARLSGDNILYPTMRLYAPGGALLATATANTEVAEITMTTASSGTFTVLVSSGGPSMSGVGTYGLRMAAIPGTFVVPDGDEGGPLQNGANQGGAIAKGDLDLWTFTADLDERIILRVARLSGDTILYPTMRLYAPSGELLATAMANTEVAEITMTAASSGTFTVLVSSGGPSKSGVGTYGLRMAAIPEPFVVPDGDEGGSLQNGADQGGAIAKGDLDLWTFHAFVSSGVLLRISKVTGDTILYPTMRLYAPDGELLATTTANPQVAEMSVTLAKTGTFTVLVGSGGPSLSGTGTYQLTASGISDSACGTAVDSDSDGIGETAAFGSCVPCTGGLTFDCLDNCPNTFNPEQTDSDGDGVGDACDACQDSDAADGKSDVFGCSCGQKSCEDASVCNGNEVCDFSSGKCAAAAAMSGCDFDSDGIDDVSDNCIFAYNPGQRDRDRDGAGDICDNCPDVFNAEQLDVDGDGTGDACAPTGAPIIGAVSPNPAGSFAKVAVSGSHFGAKQGNSRVTINNVGISVSRWQDSKIVGLMPDLPVGTYDVKVSTPAGRSNAFAIGIIDLAATQARLRSRIALLLSIIVSDARRTILPTDWQTLLTLQAYQSLDSIYALTILASGRYSVATNELVAARTLVDALLLDAAERHIGAALTAMQDGDLIRMKAASLVSGDVENLAGWLVQVHLTSQLVTKCGFVITRTPWISDAFDWADTAATLAGDLLAQDSNALAVDVARALVEKQLKDFAREHAGQLLSSATKAELILFLSDPAVAATMASDSYKCLTKIDEAFAKHYLDQTIDAARAGGVTTLGR